MTERSRASSSILEEIGWITVQWGRLEAYIDLLLAYLSKDLVSDKVPRPFNARVKFIRKALSLPVLINIRDDGERALEQALNLSRQRNDLVHGISIRWSSDDEMHQTLLKHTEEGYVAIQDISIKINNLKKISAEIQKTSARLFGLNERLKSILSLIYEQTFYQPCRLRGDREE